VLLGLLFVFCFFVNVYSVAYRDFTLCSAPPEEEEKDPKDPEYFKELGSAFSGATTHQPS